MALYEDGEQYDSTWTCPVCNEVCGFYGGDLAMQAVRNGHNASKHAYSDYRVTCGGAVLTDEDFKFLQQLGVRWSVPQGYPADKP